MRTPILSLKNITKAFGEHVVLKDINLDIYQGEILGIIGISGSGKTTLLSTIIGFYKPEYGEILFRVKSLVDNQEIGMKPVHKNQPLFKRMYGFAPQYHSFYEKLTVKENLEYFGTLYGLDKEVIKANIKGLLSFMELEAFQNKLAENLSGGMQRRLDIACSMIHEPEILLLDEPTADLDPMLRSHILKLLRDINKKGTTIIIASHDLVEMESICDRIAILHNGKILALGSPEELKKKYSKEKEIILETHPGKYDKIIKNIKGLISSYKIDGTRLIIHSDNPWSLLRKLLGVLDKNEETVIDLELREPGIEEVFIELTKKNGKDR
ncbi:ABC transporter ATP-binding protein [Candidatus Woesearchaeota archaeon]|nr:ABC transporter ATP-binding protein [Candidatus Woesearchaeota archaeon]